MSQTKPGNVIGIGGVFFKSPSNSNLFSWYTRHLGFSGSPETGAKFDWQKDGEPHSTAWCIFEAGTDYFGSSNAPFMINYIVDDLDAILDRLRSEGVSIDPKIEDHRYGRFAWIFDPDGNKIELWQPVKAPIHAPINA
jgi:predicted enzyme related to lactoylglutathione lyase